MPTSSHPLVSAPRGVWNASSGRETPSRCKRSCCWTPMGHSTVRDHLPPTDKAACRCHTTEEKP